MTDGEFMQVWSRVCDLFPKWEPTQAQMEVWRESLRRHRLDDVTKSLNEHFGVTKLNQPNLGAVMAPLKREGIQAVKTPEDWEKLLHAKNEEENTQTDWDLSAYTNQDFEDCKAAILHHEDFYFGWMKDLPANSRRWRDLIYERFVHNRAAVYKTGSAEPVGYDTREERWEKLAMRKRELAAMVKKSRAIREAAQTELATIGQTLKQSVAGGAVNE